MTPGGSWHYFVRVKTNPTQLVKCMKIFNPKYRFIGYTHLKIYKIHSEPKRTCCTVRNCQESESERKHRIIIINNYYHDKNYNSHSVSEQIEFIIEQLNATVEFINVVEKLLEKIII